MTLRKSIKLQTRDRKESMKNGGRMYQGTAYIFNGNLN